MSKPNWQGFDFIAIILYGVSSFTHARDYLRNFVPVK